MALDIPTIQDSPKFTVLTNYSVGRISQFPTASATFATCAYLTESLALVTLAEDLDNDGVKETLTVPDLGALDPSLMTGHKLCLVDSTVIGTITTATIVVITPEVRDSTGILITPAVKTAKLTMAGLTEDPTGNKVGVIKTNATGAVCYRKVSSSLEWVIPLSADRPQEMQLMTGMLGSIYFEAVKTFLTAAQITTVTDQQIIDILTSLAQNGINIDSIFANAGERLELSRRAGQIPFVSILGSAPTTP
jgi:hypothetical protein